MSAIKVKLRQEDGCLYLGPIRFCERASRWLRKAFPRGGTFRAAWEQCGDPNWLSWVARKLQLEAGESIAARCLCCGCRNTDSADAYRAEVPYEEIERLLQKVMAGWFGVVS